MSKILIVGGTGGLADYFSAHLKKCLYDVKVTSRKVHEDEDDVFHYDPCGRISNNLAAYLLTVDHILFNIGNGERKSMLDFETDDWKQSMLINFNYII